VPNGNLDALQLNLFFRRIGEVGGREVERLGGPYSRHLGPLLRKVVQELRGERASSEVRSAIDRAVAADGGDQMLRYLQPEIEFFLALSQGEAEEGDKKALGAAKTIKESMEKWLGRFLAPWVKRLLEVLNEILSLLKGG
jgi:hypothetical protein